ncbi:hypothetical protein LEMLEM_LOCUS26247, partial [Lemmus lemmus]
CLIFSLDCNSLNRQSIGKGNCKPLSSKKSSQIKRV